MLIQLSARQLVRMWCIALHAFTPKSILPTTLRLAVLGCLVLLLTPAAAQPGQIDCSWADNGMFLAGEAGKATGNDIAIYESGAHIGKVVTVYRFTGSSSLEVGIARVDSNGVLDPTFGTGGIAEVEVSPTSHDHGHAVAIQPDGKIVVCGYAALSSRNQAVVYRLNVDGTLDNTFDADGYVVYDLAHQSAFHDVAIQADGKILLLAYVQVNNGADHRDNSEVMRLNADGSRDTSFGTNGQFNFDFNPITTTSPSPFERPNGLLLQSDGSIVVCGAASISDSVQFVIGRCTSAGVLDTSFDGDGKQYLNVETDASTEELYFVEQQADGKIVALGNAIKSNTYSRLYLLRYNTDGSLDTSFDTDGMAVQEFFGKENVSQGLAIQPSDGKIIASFHAEENITTNGDEVALVRWNTDGSLDNTFGDGNGYMAHDYIKQDRPAGLVLDAAERIYTGGQAGVLSGTDNGFAVYRFHSESMNMEYCDAFAEQQTIDIAPGTQGAILRLRVVVHGDQNPFSATQLDFNTTGTDNVANVTAAKLYYTGASNVFATGTQFGSTVANPNGSFSFTGSQQLPGGRNYFWLAYDVPASGTINDTLDAQFTNLTLTTLGAQVPSITNPDGEVIIRDPYAPKVFFTDGTADYFASTDTSGAAVSILVTSNVSSPQHIALDTINRNAYWPDLSGSVDNIKRISFDNAEDTVVVDSLGSVTGIGVDAPAGKLYWTDSSNDWIKRSNLDGSGEEVWLNTIGGSPKGMALDLTNRHIYWVDSSTDKIYRTSLDVANTTETVVSDLSGGSASLKAIALDVPNNHMYYGDSGPDKVYRSTLTGGSITEVLTGTASPNAITLDLEHRRIYIVDGNLDAMVKADMDGTDSNVSTVVSGIANGSGIAYKSQEPYPVVCGTTVSITVDSTVSCNGGSDAGLTAVAASGTTPYSYSWSNTATTASITGVAANTYTVTVTDAGGCTATASQLLSNPAAMAAAVAVDSTVSCSGLSDGGATASATGGTTPYTYLWSNSATTASITGVAGGTYTATVTDANGCTASNSASISHPSAVVATSTVDSTVSCNGLSDGGATASATGGTTPYTYLWSNSATSASITGVGAATYTVTITDANGCTGSTSSSISQPSAVVASSTVDSTVSCNGLSDGGATASATGGTTPYTYLWSNSATTASITGVGAATYTVTITDANGCTGSASSSISQPSAVVASSTVDSTVSCNGLSDGGATASATGGTTPYTYLWSNSATTASITGVGAATYTVTITDANGCTGSASSSISQPSAVVASSTVDDHVSCNGLADGGATASATGGTTPYTYLWSNSATTAPITGVAGGTYTATVTDASGCTSTASATINNPAALSAGITPTHIDCSSIGAGGTLTAAPTGGTAAFTYLWSNAATTAAAAGLPAGDYTVTITDASGCTATATETMWYNCDQVVDLRPMNKQDVSVYLTWDTVCGATKYKVVWKELGASAWQVDYKHTQNGSYHLTGLNASTTYRWAIKADCGVSGWGLTAVQQGFTTLANPCDQPTGMNAAPVGLDKAKLLWTKKPFVHKYRIRWREAGTTSWTVVTKDSVWGHHWLTGLANSTTYEWQMRSVCEAGAVSGTFWTATAMFTTATPKHLPELSEIAVSETVDLHLFPNPARNVVRLALDAPDATATALLYDVSGRLMLQQRVVPHADNAIQLDFPAGIYLLKVEGKGWMEHRQLVIY